MSGTRVRLEVLVEPFIEGEPGPHVSRALAALEAVGLTPEVGPFSTSATGEVGVVAAAVSDMITTAIEHGATRVQFHVTTAI